MANKLPTDVSKKIKELVYTRADEFEYGSRSRTENGSFLNSLTADPEIGGVLRQYIPANTVRTYIKDGVLNAYAKAEVRKKLNHIKNKDVVKRLYGVDAEQVGKQDSISIYRSSDDRIFLIQSGTYLKWETALRKLLEWVAANEQLYNQARSVDLCLLLVVNSGEMSLGDRTLIEKALDYIAVKVYFAL